MKKRVLAFDFGASSGRAVLATLKNEKIHLEEVHRFANEPVFCGGHLYWDVLRLLHEIKQGLKKAHEMGGFDSVGIDTWGVDYGLIDKNGALLGNPIHYRDIRTNGMTEKISEKIPLDEIYQLTGNQIMNINTAFQLYAQMLENPELLGQARKFLLMPDLFAYFLTGNLSSERTISGTTQLFNPDSGEWSNEMISQMGLPAEIFPEIVKTGAVKGMLSDEICQELEIPSVPVIAVCGHDTQSAVVAIPATDEKPFAFISCGTWALFGTELKHPIMNADAFKMEMSNEVGYDNTVTFLKNITGLWLIQELRRTLNQRGNNYSFADLETMARNADAGKYFIDVNAEIFSTSGNMPEKVKSFCIQSGQPEPVEMGEIVRCIYESLACQFRETLDDMQKCTGEIYEKIVMLGGGVKDSLLCQLTADICGIPVYTGTTEATAMGNALVQFSSSGIVKTLPEMRKLVENSVTVRQYMPNPQNAYIYDKYKEIYQKEA